MVRTSVYQIMVFSYVATYCLIALEEYHSPAFVTSGKIVPCMIEFDG
jgi:hypothetical protein